MRWRSSRFRRSRSRSSGCSPFHEFDEANETWPRGDRPAAIREAAAEFRARFATPENRVRGVRTVDIASAGYPLKFAFGGAAKGPNPYVNIINRLQVVQFEDFDGELQDARLGADGPRGAGRGAVLRAADRAARRVPLLQGASRRSGTTPTRRWPRSGCAPEDVDYVSFDHLHVQDLRFVLGHHRADPGRGRAAPAAVPEREADRPAQGVGHLRVDAPDAVGLVRRGRASRT